MCKNVLLGRCLCRDLASDLFRFLLITSCIRDVFQPGSSRSKVFHLRLQPQDPAASTWKFAMRTQQESRTGVRKTNVVMFLAVETVTSSDSTSVSRHQNILTGLIAPYWVSQTIWVMFRRVFLSIGSLSVNFNLRPHSLVQILVF